MEVWARFTSDNGRSVFFIPIEGGLDGCGDMTDDYLVVYSKAPGKNGFYHVIGAVGAVAESLVDVDGDGYPEGSFYEVLDSSNYWISSLNPGSVRVVDNKKYIE